MDDNTKKEEFSYGYIKLLASVIGCEVLPPTRAMDNQGIDITIRAPETINEIFSPSIDAQVKCTSQDIIKETDVHFALPIKNYERLRAIKTERLQILIVVVVPREINTWVNIDENQTLAKKCGYWISLKNSPPSTNSTSVTIKIPRMNLFTPTVINDLMEKQTQLLNAAYDLETIT